MKLNSLIEQALKLQAEGKGDLDVFILDGHSGMPYAWSGWLNLEVYDDAEADGELAASSLKDDDEYVQLSFG